MTTQALYNKWRAQTFDDVLGQEHITHTLRNQIRAGRIGHAYLFTGLRGTGKTSTARIMAKAVNCIGETDSPPCNACHICHSITDGRSLDLIEIDAASNRGIDEIRELRERVSFVPHECRYKVYVIDEVHMLTNEAFNALLKTLEEPPAHVIFILATTEPHRLPDTILSRCQRFDFRRGAVSTLIHKLGLICESEGIQIESTALEFIARRASGSFRDAESLLDQLASYGDGQVTLAMVQNVLGSPSVDLVLDIVEAFLANDAPTGLRAINEAIDQGAEPRQFLSELIDHFRGILFLRVGSDDDLEQLAVSSVERLRKVNANYSVSPSRLVKALRLLNDAGQGLRYASRPQLPLELAFIESIIPLESSDQAETSPQPQEVAAVTSVGAPTDAAARRKPAPEASSASVQLTAMRETPIQAAASSDEPHTEPPGASVKPPFVSEPVAESFALPAKAEPEAIVAEPSPPMTLDWVQGNWSVVLLKIRRYHQVRALLNSAYPVQVQGNQIVLGCEADFHKEKLGEDKRRAVVEEVMSEVLGRPVTIACVVSDQRDVASAKATPAPPAGQNLFSAQADQESARDELRNHPTVKALEKRGGYVVDVKLNSESKGD